MGRFSWHVGFDHAFLWRTYPPFLSWVSAYISINASYMSNGDAKWRIPSTPHLDTMTPKASPSSSIAISRRYPYLLLSKYDRDPFLNIPFYRQIIFWRPTSSHTYAVAPHIFSFAAPIPHCFPPTDRRHFHLPQIPPLSDSPDGGISLPVLPLFF